MYYFEGNYRRTLEQNFAGASRVRDKSELIGFARSERRKREENREKEKASIRIQSVVRGFLERRRVSNSFSIEFDRYPIPEAVRPEDLLYLTRRLPFLRHSPSRILSTSRLIWSSKEVVLSEDWTWRLKYLVGLNLHLLPHQESQAFVEFFTNKEPLIPIIGEEKAGQLANDITSYLVSKNYFQTCFSLLESHQFSQMIARPFVTPSQSAFDQFSSALNNLKMDNYNNLIILSSELKKPAVKFDRMEFHKSILRLGFQRRNPLLFLFLLSLDDEEISEYESVKVYFQLMSLFTRILHKKHESDDFESYSSKSTPIINDIVGLLNTKSKALIWISYLTKIIENNDYDTLTNYGISLHNLYLIDNLPINRNIIFIELYRRRYYIKHFWCCITNMNRDSIPLTNLIIKNIPLENEDVTKIIPLLTVFSVLLRFSISNMTDDLEKPFNPAEMKSVSKILVEIAIGVVLVAYPVYTNKYVSNKLFWSCLLNELVNVLSLLQARDARNETYWISNVIKMPDHVQIYDSTQVEVLQPFLSPNNSGLVQLSPQESRTIFILTHLPFTVQFLKRFSYLQLHFEAEKLTYLIPNLNRLVRIRRNYLYEDAFENLFKNGLKHFRIQMVNDYGLDEAGVDGGGVFREFIIKFLTTAFDPTRGFFIYNNDNELYPNPSVFIAFQNFKMHYNFIGRMLAKAILEGIMLEIRLAEFFLAKLTGVTNLHLSNLSSLDPELYRNLVDLQKYKGDFSDLSLDFTIYTSEFGRSVCKELKHNGSNIQVNSDNLCEYIELVAKFKMHDEIIKQTDAFVEGIGEVFYPDCLKMFTPKEIQIIISGDESPINIEDMKNNTIYAGGYTEDHPCVVMFWNVVGTFTVKERSDLLKFITSYSRPPLLGFRELHPPICILRANGVDERFPTSSTCMHLLKLPSFSDEAIMKSKLLYAITSGTGFELS